MEPFFLVALYFICFIIFPILADSDFRGSFVTYLLFVYPVLSLGIDMVIKHFFEKMSLKSNLLMYVSRFTFQSLLVGACVAYIIAGSVFQGLGNINLMLSCLVIVFTLANIVFIYLEYDNIFTSKQNLLKICATCLYFLLYSVFIFDDLRKLMKHLLKNKWVQKKEDKQRKELEMNYDTDTYEEDDDNPTIKSIKNQIQKMVVLVIDVERVNMVYENALPIVHSAEQVLKEAENVARLAYPNGVYPENVTNLLIDVKDLYKIVEVLALIHKVNNMHSQLREKINNKENQLDSLENIITLYHDYSNTFRIIEQTMTTIVGRLDYKLELQYNIASFLSQMVTTNDIKRLLSLVTDNTKQQELISKLDPSTTPQNTRKPTDIVL